MLASEIKLLQDDGFAVDLLGFGEDELAGMLDVTQGLTNPDAIPDAPANPRSVVGDIWQLGRHRIICGDCTDATVVSAVLAGVAPHLMVTDPPYGVEYDPSWRVKAGVNKNTEKLGKVLNDDRADWREAWALFPGDVAYIWHASLFTRDVLDSLEACGFEHRSMIIWAKDRFTLGRGHYHWQHEPCWYVVRKGSAGHWGGGRSQSTIWNIPAREDKGVGHGTQKPVECMKRPIENNSSPGQAIYEPFSGSGTTIIAAEMSGRACYAVELNPAYVDVAVKRWQEFTGLEAKHSVTGQAFNG
jgi:DNA modification methylase